MEMRRNPSKSCALRELIIHQLIGFSIMEPAHLGCVMILVIGDVPVDSEARLYEFQNLSIQSFRCAHKGRIYVRVFIE
jgi:hypothetical protein